MKSVPTPAFLLLFSLLVALPCSAGERQSTRPNIIIIMAEDVGYSDIGCYGGEIETPNLDMLAAGGVRFGQFYNTARCCPTRASLLTGLYAHQAGIGHMVDSGSAKVSDAYAGDRRRTGWKGQGKAVKLVSQTPTHMLPLSRKPTPPNIFFSVMLLFSRSSLRTRSASESL